MSPGNVVRKPLSMSEQRVEDVGLNSAAWITSGQSGSILKSSRLLHTGLVGMPECGLKAWPGKSMDINYFGLSNQGFCTIWLALGIIFLVLPRPFVGCEGSFFQIFIYTWSCIIFLWRLCCCL